jgi:small subunit ribosomal protein S9
MVKKKMLAQKAAVKVQRTKKRLGKPLSNGVGRRKGSAVARVWLRPGTGSIMVNGLDFTRYFDTKMTQLTVTTAQRVCPGAMRYNIEANVHGGGKVGQADATKLGIARALLTLDPDLRPTLRANNLLTFDGRVKESKKYGRKAARRRFQFVKR